MTLNVFDFDDTIFRIPGHLQAPPHIDIKANINNWYDHDDSLNENLHKIQLIETVADYIRSGADSKDHRNILITRRVESQTKNIERILESHDLWFDMKFIIGHNLSKPDILAEFMNDSVIEFDEIVIFEDSLFQIHDYQDKLPWLKLKFMFVDKTHLLEIKSFDTREVSKLNLKQV